MPVRCGRGDPSCPRLWGRGDPASSPTQASPRAAVLDLETRTHWSNAEADVSGPQRRALTLSNPQLCRRCAAGRDTIRPAVGGRGNTQVSASWCPRSAAS